MTEIEKPLMTSTKIIENIKKKTGGIKDASASVSYSFLILQNANLK